MISSAYIVVFFSKSLATAFFLALKILFILSYSRLEAVIVLFSLTALEFPVVKTFSSFFKYVISSAYIVVFFSKSLATAFFLALKILFILSYSRLEAVIVLFSLTALEFPVVKIFSSFFK